MKVGREEQDGIKTAIRIGEQIGYGNLIAHLKSAWAEFLLRKNLVTNESDALELADNQGYPLAMHRDCLDRGEWDETGQRYREKL